MFDQLDLSPMMLLMLLLYGLLIAVILVLWTALDLGGRRKAKERTAEQPAQAATQPARRTQVTQQEPAKAAPAQPQDARAARRAADSDSVVSYSVRPRVTAQEQRPVHAEPAAEPARPAGGHRQRPEQVPTAEVDFPTGRETRQSRPEKPKTVTPVRPPPARDEQRGNPQRSRSEDAFERFLRSSGNDNDDY